MAQLQAMKKPLSAPFIKKIQAVSHCSYIRVSKKVPEKCLVENAQTALFSSVRSQTKRTHLSVLPWTAAFRLS